MSENPFAFKGNGRIMSRDYKLKIKTELCKSWIKTQNCPYGDTSHLHMVTMSSRRKSMFLRVTRLNFVSNFMRISTVLMVFDASLFTRRS